MDKEKKPIIIETADIYLHFPYIMKEEADDLADFLEEKHIEYEGATDIFIGLQQQCKKQKEVIIKVMNLIKKYGKYDGEKCTQGFQMWSADFNKILDILQEVSE